jgi:hypothetical protein
VSTGIVGCDRGVGSGCGVWMWWVAGMGVVGCDGGVGVRVRGAMHLGVGVLRPSLARLLSKFLWVAVWGYVMGVGYKQVVMVSVLSCDMGVGVRV